MEKLKMHSANLTQDNIARIRDLFPNCITEAKGEDGSVKLVVDFDQLRQELAESIVEGSQERYHLNWPGKREALLTANSPIAMTLRPCREESVNFDTTKNLFIEGDNLDALKLLQDNYLGKVKMIYIDPPYNTGNDFIYEDDFAEDATSFLKKSNQKDDEGNRLIANTEANGRFHSDWLSMIYPRLRIARTLLKDDGVIFISIDDNEAANLKKICDEVFGEANFLANIVWRRTVSGAVSGQGFTVSHDHILCYAKSENYSLGRLEVEDEDKYKNPDNDPRGSYKTQKLERTLEGARPTMTFEIQTPAGPITRTWACSPQKYQELLADNRIVFSSSGQPYYKQFLNEYKGRLPDTWWEKSQGNNQEGSKELSALMGQKNIFTNPKPTKLIKHALRIGCGPNDIFMDFFAGSGSSADAVMQLNAEDGGRRRFIMVQLPEVCRTDSEAYKAGFKNIAEITRQRIRLSGAKIFQDSGKGAGDIDIGFRSFRVDSSNLKDVFYTPDAMEVGNLDLFVDNIKPDRTPEDLLFQVMLDWGVDLALPITKQAIQDKYVFLVDGNALAACFDGHGGVDEDFVKELAKVQPLRAVFRDAGFKDSSVKINVEQIFKLLSPATEVKCI